MKKKISYMLIGAICTTILSYGFVAYADHASTTGTEDKPTTASDTYVVPSKADAAALKAASVQPKATEGPVTLDQLKEMEMKISGSNISIKIELKKDEEKAESKVEVKRGKDQEKRLTGAEAIQFIQQLLASLKLQANMNPQQLTDALSKHFAVEPAKVELKLEIKMVNQPAEIKVVHEKEEADEDKDKDKDEDKDAAKAKLAALPAAKSDQAAQNNEVEKNDQLTKQAQKKALIAQKKALQKAWIQAHKEQQAKKKQQQKLERGDRDDDHHDGKKDDEDDDDNDQGNNHGHGHEDHDDEDED